MRVSRTTGAMSGLVIVVLGFWGGLIPFIGPYFNFMFGPHATWHYSTQRLWLAILPGAAAVVGGLMIMYAGSRISGIVGGWLALAGGAWFVIGPSVSGLWRSGAAAAAGPIGAPFGGTTRQTIELVGYFYGVGVLIIGLAAFALGRYVSRPGVAAVEETGPGTYAYANERYTERPMAREPVAERPTSEEPVVERPAAEQPATEQPATQQPATQQPATQQPATEQPATEQPATEKPATEQQASEQPTTAQQREPVSTGGGNNAAHGAPRRRLNIFGGRRRVGR